VGPGGPERPDELGTSQFSEFCFALLRVIKNVVVVVEIVQLDS
jgi:hypothetical protein